jgi:hypothetical protein
VEEFHVLFWSNHGNVNPILAQWNAANTGGSGVAALFLAVLDDSNEQ